MSKILKLDKNTLMATSKESVVDDLIHYKYLWEKHYQEFKEFKELQESKNNVTEEFKPRESKVKWFIISAISKGKIEINESLRAEPRILKMSLNGQDIDPLHAIEKMHEQFDALVVKKAKVMVSKLKDKITEPLEAKIEELTNLIDDVSQSVSKVSQSVDDVVENEIKKVFDK